MLAAMDLKNLAGHGHNINEFENKFRLVISPPILTFYYYENSLLDE